jgi:hypothetical protein
MSGYTDTAYAASFAEFGRPRLLPCSGGWVLERSIPQTPYRDAMGCYPLFACQDWSQLHVDLDNIGKSLVCLSLVTDPFGEYDLDVLRECFPDLMISFKEHFVVDLKRAPETFVRSHHQRNVRKALREIRVEECDDPLDSLEEWAGLYAMLVERHDITGIPAFSRESFAGQLRVPGIVAIRAVHNGATVGMLLWYGHKNRAYYHLGAYNRRGYELGASFALFDYAIKYFAERGFEWLNLGSGSGIGTGADQGLTRFKQGWSSGTRIAYLCGRIFDHETYRRILETREQPPTSYFPAYRVGEFSG